MIASTQGGFSRAPKAASAEADVLDVGGRMCGIIAYLGDGDTVAVLLEGLKRMEYRGYDSAGLACVLRDSGELEVQKKSGKVANLLNACQTVKLAKGNTSVGIAHTRWATHGPPTDVNAHPHCTADNSMA